MYDAIVVGGGIVGSSTAYHLVDQGAKTLLIDRLDRGRATAAGAGILSPETNTRDPESWLGFALEANSYYPTLIRQLQDEQAGDTGYHLCGRLIVAMDDTETELLNQVKQRIFERQEHWGRPGTEDLYPVSAQEAQTLFPALGTVRAALYYRGAARVDGQLLTQALQRAAAAKGLIIRQASVDRLRLNERAVTGVSAGGETLQTGSVAVAGGAWSQAFGEQLEVKIPVEPQRGQILHLHLPDVDTHSWPIVSAFREHYMLAWPGGRIVAGATRETDSGYRPSTSAAGIQEVLSEALRVAPGLAQAEIREMRVGLRPLSADGFPVLGRVPGLANIFLATGHGPTGLLLGPYSGKVVADLMLGHEVTTDISPFDISRFL